MAVSACVSPTGSPISSQKESCSNENCRNYLWKNFKNQHWSRGRWHLLLPKIFSTPHYPEILHSQFIHCTFLLLFILVPDDVPKNFRVHLKTKLSCTVNWTSLDPTKTNGIFRGYSVNVYDTNSTNQSSVGKYYAACPTVTVQGLQPFRLYNISVKGFNSLAFSNASYFQCMTEEDGM